MALPASWMPKAPSSLKPRPPMARNFAAPPSINSAPVGRPANGPAAPGPPQPAFAPPSNVLSNSAGQVPTQPQPQLSTPQPEPTFQPQPQPTPRNATEVTVKQTPQQEQQADPVKQAQAESIRAQQAQQQAAADEAAAAAKQAEAYGDYPFKGDPRAPQIKMPPPGARAYNPFTGKWTEPEVPGAPKPSPGSDPAPTPEPLPTHGGGFQAGPPPGGGVVMSGALGPEVKPIAINAADIARRRAAAAAFAGTRGGPNV